MGAIIEFRNSGAKLEVRDAFGGARPRLSGYAAKFNTLSRPIGAMKFREKIDPHAFDETLAGRPDVRFTLNHDPNHVMGRTNAGTLKLFTDRVGLGFDLDVPDSQTAHDLVQSVKRGDISDCSFKFRTLDDAWSEDENGDPIRTLKKVSLHDGDVAAVTYPAYPNTEINARALEAIEMRGRECLGIRRLLTPAECDRELERAFAEFEVKVCPTTPLLYGYATVFHRLCANVRDGARAVLVRGAFAGSIARDAITANSIGHDKYTFASTVDGSVKLSEDDYGLRFEIRPSTISEFQRSEFQRIFEKVQRGQVQQMSIRYAWRADDAHRDIAKGMEFIHKARLSHISPSSDGAFPGTSISAGYGSLESIAGAEAAARDRELQLASIEV